MICTTAMINSYNLLIFPRLFGKQKSRQMILCNAASDLGRTVSTDGRSQSELNPGERAAADAIDKRALKPLDSIKM